MSWDSQHWMKDSQGWKWERGWWTVYSKMSQGKEYVHQQGFLIVWNILQDYLFLKITQQMRNPACGGFASDHHVQINKNLYEWTRSKSSSACLTLTLMWTNPGKAWDIAAKPDNGSYFVWAWRQLLMLSSSHGKKMGVAGDGSWFWMEIQRSPCQCLQNIRAEWNMGSLAKKHFKSYLPRRTGAGILSACAIPMYACFALTCTK